MFLPMWKVAFKETFRFLFDNPVIFLIILGNYALVFLLGPFLGFIGFFFIALFYLVGLHGNLENLWEEIRRFSKWAFVVALVQYLLFFGLSFLSYLVYKGLKLNLYTKTGETFAFAILWSLILSLIIHPVWLLLYGSTSPEELKKNLKSLKRFFTKGWGVFLLLWGFMFLTVLAGLVRFLHFTIGLYAVLASFWLTYYTFLGVRLLKAAQKEV
jgi:hypothetical protein